MTVSRVVNGSGYVRDEVRTRVQDAIEQLDYSPNWLARSLKRKATLVVGIVLPDIANPYAAELAHGIQDILREAGYGCFLSSVDATGSNEESILQALSDHRVDGIIVATRHTGEDGLHKLASRHIPMVVIGREFDHPSVDRVAANDRAGGFAALRHLMELGHRRIAFIGGSATAPFQLPRCAAYLDGLREQGLPVDPELVIPPIAGERSLFATQHDGYMGMQKLLLLRSRPTAVFARNDYTAMGALLAAREAGVAVPGDISIIGFDNVPLSSFTAPPLTTVKQPIAEQGREAATLLLNRIQSEVPVQRTERVFECHLVVRESTAPPARG